MRKREQGTHRVTRARRTGGTQSSAGITLDWFRYFLAQYPQLDWTTITRAAYERFWDQSVEEYGIVIGTDNPDLSVFRDRGGKMIIWHGWAGPLITAEGTIDYYQRVQRQMGGAEWTSQFARLFMAPDIGHCGGGAGDSDGRSPRSGRGHHAVEAAVPVSAGCQVQGQRERG